MFLKTVGMISNVYQRNTKLESKNFNHVFYVMIPSLKKQFKNYKK